MDKIVLDIIYKSLAPNKGEISIQIFICQKNIPFFLIYRIILQMQISTKQKEKRKPAMFSYFPWYYWFCVINRPKQLLLVSLPCHNVLTHYVFSNTFGMLGFPSESQYLRGWKQNLNTVRNIQNCSKLEIQWTAQLPWDVHYLRRNKSFFFLSFYLFNYLIFIFGLLILCLSFFLFPRSHNQHKYQKMVNFNK